MSRPKGRQPLFTIADGKASTPQRLGAMVAWGAILIAMLVVPRTPARAYYGQDTTFGPRDSGGGASVRVQPSKPPVGEILPEPDAIFRQARDHFRAGRTREAKTRLQEGLKSYPGYPPMHELLGLALSTLGEDSEALQHLKRAAELWPDQPVYQINLGIFYLRRSRAGDAEKALQLSLEAGPSPVAYSLLGLIRLEQNAGEEAVSLFKKGLELAPDDARSWYYLGLVHQSLAQNDSAISCFREVLRRAPHDFHAHLQMGKVYLKRGLREQALKHLQSAQELRPGNPELYQPLSEAYLGTGDLESALAAAQRAVELRPTDRQAHYVLGMVLARVGRTEDATKEFHISEGLPRAPEPSALERWREIAGQTPVANEANP